MPSDGGALEFHALPSLSNTDVAECGSRMRLRALVTAAASIARYLRHIGEPTEPPPLWPA